MGKMIYEPKHGHKHDPPAIVPDTSSPWGLFGKEPEFNSIWVCECGQHFKYRKSFMPSHDQPRGHWKKIKPKNHKPINDEVITTSAHLETKIIPRMVNHRTSGEYEVENRPQYRYVSEWFDGEIEGDRNYQKFEMRVNRGTSGL